MKIQSQHGASLNKCIFYNSSVLMKKYKTLSLQELIDNTPPKKATGIVKGVIAIFI